ncbi:MAG: hypothetical protein D6693_05905 [Planctomycetota bacterium]|nr:MAG: hypothetical protein D6693_05905 [Planctomycetota bacterium]
MIARRTLVVCAAASLSLPVSAEAQNALGDGRALDTPLQRGARVNPARPDFAAEVALRNAIVTGNIGGGFAFRGDVGYRAPGEFTGGDVTLSAGALRGLGVTAGAIGGAGSDDLFAFQRDAARSAFGVRGLDGLRYQMGLTTDLGLAARPGDLLIARPSGAPLAPTGVSRLGEVALDPFTLRPGALRSTTAHLADALLEPTALDRHDSGDALTYTIADPLRGVVRYSTPADGAQPEAAGDGADDAERSPLRVDNRVSDRLEPAAIDLRVSPVLRSLRDSLKPAGPVEPEAGGGAEPDESAPAAPDTGPDELDARLGRLRSAMAGAGEPIEETDVPETLALLRRLSPIVSKYTSESGPHRDVFAEHMREAQARLAQGRWFDAEERFSAALVIRPDDPLAMAGRLHAQIGAGLFLSASVNLRTFLTAHPEFIATRFDPSLTPSAQRLAQIEAMLRRSASASTPMAARSGLLLAYLGFQRGDEAAVRDGFEAIDRARDAAGEAPDPFVDVLRRAWAAD